MTTPEAPERLLSPAFWEKKFHEGGFTPFLGAGASSLRPKNYDLETEPWSYVKAAILQTYRQLQRKSAEVPNDVPEKDEMVKYLKAFVEQALRPSDLEEIFAALVDDAEIRLHRSADWPCGDLVHFFKYLVIVAVDFSNLFGYSFAHSYPSLHDISDLQVHVSTETAEYQRAVRNLGMLIDASRQLPEDNCPSRVRNCQPPKLRGDLIERKLTQLRDEIHLPVSGQTGQLVTLSLSRLQWLSDLLWYMLVSWIPHYPTTSELSFELSLHARHARPRVASLARAAEATLRDDADLAEIIKTRLRYCEKAGEFYESPSRNIFHLSIVAVLRHAYEKYREATRLSGRRSKGPDAMAGLSDPPGDDGQHERPLIPLAVSTNFDRGIEKSFITCQIPFHVVYPVRGKNDEGKWLLKTWEPNKTPTVKEGDVLGQAEDLVGPVILKLHGSPLEVKEEDGVEPWLVLSETNYLRALGSPEQSVPSWFNHELRKRGGRKYRSRNLWFLGYSVTDWNVRLRLYDHACHSRDTTHNDLRKFLIDRQDMDLFRSAVFESLEIERYQFDLNWLPDLFCDALDLSGPHRSRDLKCIWQEILNLRKHRGDSG